LIGFRQTIARKTGLPWSYPSGQASTGSIVQYPRPTDWRRRGLVKPAALCQQSRDALAVKVGRKGIPRLVAARVADPMSGHDVFSGRRTPVLHGLKVLGRCSQSRELAAGAAIAGAEGVGIRQPHGGAAVVAAAALMGERTGAQTVDGRHRGSRGQGTPGPL
jgi:hypothetical protein